MNFYVAENLDYVTKMLTNSESGINTTSNSLQDKRETGSDVWLLFVPQFVMKLGESFSNVFIPAPLRLDSFVYAFYENIQGKIKNVLITPITPPSSY